MRKMRIKLLNNKYICACHIKINKGTKVLYVLPRVRVPLVEYHCYIASAVDTASLDKPSIECINGSTGFQTQSHLVSPGL
jgi:hypothetical protein